MTDIITLFLDSANVVRIERVLARDGVPFAKNGARGAMVEFVQGPLVAGLYDIWSGTDVDLMVKQMNDEFVAWARRAAGKPVQPDEAREMRARLDPIVDADKWRGAMRDGRSRDYGFVQPLAAQAIGADRTSGAAARALYERTSRDQAAVRHLMARDDEADDIGFDPSRDPSGVTPIGGCDRARTLDAQIADHQASIAAPRASGDECSHWDDDSSQASVCATPYHMAVLDSQLSVMNGKCALAGPRPRVGGFIPISGSGPAQSRRGRVTLDDSRWLAQDIFARDSKGCMVKGYHELPLPFTCR